MHFVKVMIIFVLPYGEGLFYPRHRIENESYSVTSSIGHLLQYKDYTFKVPFLQQGGWGSFHQKNSWSVFSRPSSRRHWNEILPIGFDWNEIGSLRMNFRLMEIEWPLMNKILSNVIMMKKIVFWTKIKNIICAFYVSITSLIYPGFTVRKDLCWVQIACAWFNIPLFFYVLRLKCNWTVYHCEYWVL